jgi:hypothetical protein
VRQEFDPKEEKLWNRAQAKGAFHEAKDKVKEKAGQATNDPNLEAEGHPGVIIGPPLNMLSSTMKKYFSIRERAQLRLEFLAVNTLNHLGYLSTPDVTVTNLATAGTITAASSNRDGGQPRQVQVIVRVEW